MANIFNAIGKKLSDDSEVFAVFATDEKYPASVVVWPAPPSEHTARVTAETLNSVLEAFARCGSDREALWLARRITRAC